MKSYKKLGDKKSIWRILISSDDKLLLETRDEEKKIVHFYVADLALSKNEMIEIPHEEPYWTGVENFSERYLITHGFAKPDLPGHLGIAVYSFDEKKYLWEDKQSVFLLRKGESIFTYQQKFDSREYTELDINTGKLIASHGENHELISTLLDEVREMEDYSMYGFPSPVAYDLSVLDIASDLNADSGNFINLEFLRHNDYIFVSYHAWVNGRYNNFLHIYQNGKLKEKLVLNEKTERLIAESWFIYKDLLITIENKTMLKIYKLV